MDLAHALKVALDTGTVRIGLTQTLEAADAKKARLVIVASSCPDPRLAKERAIGRIPIYHYDGTAVELGQACGRPHPISAMAVIDPGSSAILSLETS
ncbi:MAG: 50S ribosomal protein L30e [Thermoplasmatales archaeon]|jgi:large subunit ribosomal protein L30e|nr:50S ribosomal protein L30e [Candidatus Thermoplasmatota archaeon]MCL5983816.1 50S ribosomal protein L30e [Candidatus Thermoplasmatota archaeon]MCW6167204.1 50S ribosomal protein L30e [Thermoplasmatales archaeon]